MSYARQVAQTYVTRIAMMPAGVLIAVIAARWLGPVDYGVFVAIGAAIGIIGQVTYLGLPTAASRFVAAEPGLTPVLIANSRLSGALTGIAGIGLLFGIAALFPRLVGEVPITLLLLASLALPLTATSAQLQGLLLGRSRVSAYNALALVGHWSLAGAALVVLVLAGRGLSALVWATVALAVLQFALYDWVLRPDSRRWLPDLTVLRRMEGYSLRAYATVLLRFLVLRSDIVLVNAVVGPVGAAVYGGVAVRCADALLLLPSVTATLLLPRVAAEGSRGSAVLTAKLCRHTVFLMALACLASGAVAWWAVPLLFGETFAAAVPSLWILLPGIWCMALLHTLTGDLSGRELPAVLPLIWAVTLGVNIILNLWWLPRIGPIGAAASSTISYALALVLIARYWLKRFPEIGLRSLLLLEAGEFRELAARIGGSISRLAARR